MWTEHRFIAFDETPLFYRVHSREGAKAIAILVHGMGEHGGRYQHLGDYLAEFEIESWIPDLRGHGRSGGKPGHISHFSDLHRDLSALHSLIDKTRKGLPIFLVGHSFGGLTASSYLAYHPHFRVDGLVLTSPLFGIAVHAPWWKRLLGLTFSALWPSFTQANGVLASDLTHDQAILENYRRDAQVHHLISARLYCEVLSMLKQKKEIAGRIKKPVLVLQAGEDRIVSKKDTLSFYDDLKVDDRELEVYPGFYHEILNETVRQAVFSRIANWMLKRTV